MSKILESIAPVIEQANHVSISRQKLEDFCAKFSGLESNFKQPFKSVSLSPIEKMQLDFAFNAANFCYWKEPKWTIVHQGNRISGAYGMKAAFNRALEEGFPLTDPIYIETLSEEDFEQIIRGEGTLPLIAERLSFLHQAGRILREKYELSVGNLVESGKGDALQLLDEITSNFPCYDDSVEYRGRKVLFHKRAQLFVNNAHNILVNEGSGLSRTEELTALADYKVPQLLRNRGILEYGESLAQRIDNYELISAGSNEEVEIRAFTLEACEQIAEDLRGKFPGLKVIDLDRWLYLESKKPSPSDKPHHRAITTAH